MTLVAGGALCSARRLKGTATRGRHLRVVVLDGPGQAESMLGIAVHLPLRLGGEGRGRAPGRLGSGSVEGIHQGVVDGHVRIQPPGSAHLGRCSSFLRSRLGVRWAPGGGLMTVSWAFEGAGEGNLRGTCRQRFRRGGSPSANTFDIESGGGRDSSLICYITGLSWSSSSYGPGWLLAGTRFCRRTDAGRFAV